MENICKFNNNDCYIECKVKEEDKSNQEKSRSEEAKEKSQKKASDEFRIKAWKSQLSL